MRFGCKMSKVLEGAGEMGNRGPGKYATELKVGKYINLNDWVSARNQRPEVSVKESGRDPP